MNFKSVIFTFVLIAIPVLASPLAPREAAPDPNVIKPQDNKFLAPGDKREASSSEVFPIRQDTEFLAPP
ncbi:hypothetical protein CVT24_007619 [Panaeolus cyanescens]|uniref:Uncharacterized protein n=1 Tax=Panaeolus cyanescens TaxID=181874 RepID=A0A409YKK7_9AGAR|nr:hypothetical protein CVT24_007619 [Panaeolus cyanescens]